MDMSVAHTAVNPAKTCQGCLFFVILAPCIASIVKVIPEDKTPTLQKET